MVEIFVTKPFDRNRENILFLWPDANHWLTYLINFKRILFVDKFRSIELKFMAKMWAKLHEKSTNPLNTNSIQFNQVVSTLFYHQLHLDLKHLCGNIFTRRKNFVFERFLHLTYLFTYWSGSSTHDFYIFSRYTQGSNW